MAGIARKRGWNVQSRLAFLGQHTGAVVTRCARRCWLNLSMIKRFCWRPTSRRHVVTLLARVAGVESALMLSTLAFGASKRAAMTTDATCGQGGVVHLRASPHCGPHVTRLASKCGRNVLNRIFAFFGKITAAVMTGRTGRGRLDLGMIKGLERRPRGRFVIVTG